MSPDLSRLDATAQADLVRRGELSPSELVEAAIARIEKLNPELNAVILPQFERARARAAAKDLPDGPFRGVPFLLKDLGAHLAGDPVHLGMRALKERGWTEAGETRFAAGARRAGLVSLGRTNTPELGLLPTTESDAYGATRNPWDLERSAGGSSGGSAAAVTSGMVAMAHASDGGGSIRIPASHCGLVGLKPTRGRNSFGPELGERWAGFSAEGVVSRSVRDTAAFLDAVSGPAPGDPYFAPLPARPFTGEVEHDPGVLRIGLVTQGRGDAVTHPECVAAATGAARLLESLGHRVEESAPAALLEGEIMGAFVTIVGCSTARALDAWGAKTGAPIGQGDCEPLTWALAQLGRARSGPDYVAALEAVHAYSRRMASWWQEGFDLLLTPTVAEPPPPLGHFAPTADEPMRGYFRAAPFGVFTTSFNMTGQPAISLPLHWTPEGLPVGAQLVADFAREDLLLRVAAQLERAQPWSNVSGTLLNRSTTSPPI